MDPEPFIAPRLAGVSGFEWRDSEYVQKQLDAVLSFARLEHAERYLELAKFHWNLSQHFQQQRASSTQIFLAIGAALIAFAPKATLEAQGVIGALLIAIGMVGCVMSRAYSISTDDYWGYFYSFLKMYVVVGNKKVDDTEAKSGAELNEVYRLWKIDSRAMYHRKGGQLLKRSWLWMLMSGFLAVIGAFLLVAALFRWSLFS